MDNSKTEALLRPEHPSVLGVIGNAVRGALIGAAELVPGVSGGTVALVTGVYERILTSGAHGVDGLRALVSGRGGLARAKDAFRKVDWWLLVPLIIGMATIVVSLAGAMKAFVQGQPVNSRALFFGMVAVSLIVPVSMAREDRRGPAWASFVYVAIGAVLAFNLAGAGAEIADPSLLVVFGAAALAVCALVLPGVSGSYLLLVLGLYAATTGAVAERNVTYIAVFAAGAAVGLALFVKVLHYLLDNVKKPTLLVMTGLMLGSLRALWPWQDANASLQAPGVGWPLALLLAVVGGAAVAALLLAEKHFGGGKAIGMPAHADDASSSAS